MRRIILIAIAVSMLSLLPALASGGGSLTEGCAGSCASCHSLTAEEAAALLKASSMAPADSRVEKVEAMESVGLWKVTLDTEGERPLFIDFGKENVFVGEFYPLRRPPFASSGEEWTRGK